MWRHSTRPCYWIRSLRVNIHQFIWSPIQFYHVFCNISWLISLHSSNLSTINDHIICEERKWSYHLWRKEMCNEILLTRTEKEPLMIEKKTFIELEFSQLGIKWKNLRSYRNYIRCYNRTYIRTLSSKQETDRANS